MQFTASASRRAATKAALVLVVPSCRTQLAMAEAPINPEDMSPQQRQALQQFNQLRNVRRAIQCRE